MFNANKQETLCHVCSEADCYGMEIMDVDGCMVYLTFTYRSCAFKSNIHSLLSLSSVFET